MLIKCLKSLDATSKYMLIKCLKSLDATSKFC